jgi:hypothetical protein
MWTALSTNIRIRDRSVKALQYGCQMLLGYYGERLSDDVKHTLTITRKNCSTARKSFWLLKSLNHVSVAIDLILSFSFEFDNHNLRLLELLEQLALIVYYMFENIVFLSRNNLILLEEDRFEENMNVAWFIGDLCGFVSSLVHLICSFEHQKKFESYLFSSKYFNDFDSERIEKKVFDNTLLFVIVSFFCELHYFGDYFYDF